MRHTFEFVDIDELKILAGMNFSKIGDNIKYMRDFNKLSISRLAILLDINETTLIYIEEGKIEEYTDESILIFHHLYKMLRNKLNDLLNKYFYKILYIQDNTPGNIHHDIPVIDFTRLINHPNPPKKKCACKKHYLSFLLNPGNHTLDTVLIIRRENGFYLFIITHERRCFYELYATMKSTKIAFDRFCFEWGITGEHPIIWSNRIPISADFLKIFDNLFISKASKINQVEIEQEIISFSGPILSKRTLSGVSYE